MKHAILFLTIAAFAAYQSLSIEAVWGMAIGLNAAAGFAAVGLGFAGLGPRIFFKRANGTLPTISYLLYWPYHLLNALVFLLIQTTSNENPADEIADGIFLGRRLNRLDTKLVRARAFRACLDLTSEFGEHPDLRSLSDYLCIPLLDTTAPNAAQLRQGVAFLSAAPRPAYVHCAVGHGRSATFVAAYLLASRRVSGAEEAVALIKRRRPRIDLHGAQREALDRFQES